MITKESASAIATMLKVDAEDFWAKLKNEEEVGFDVPKLNVFTDADLETRLQNEKAISYSDGKTAQEEMLVKQAKRDFGYDFEGKSFSKFLEHHEGSLKEKYSKSSTDRVVELENDIKNLNKSNQDLINSLKNENEQFKAGMQKQRTVNKLLSIMPKETTIESDDIMTLFLSKHQVETKDGVELVSRDGAVIKDETTASPIELKEVFSSFIEDRGYAKKSGGRGGRDEGGNSTSKTNSITQFQKDWSASGKSINSKEYDVAYAQWRKDTVDVVV